MSLSLALPFDVIARELDGCRVAMEFLMDGVRSVFQKVGIDPIALEATVERYNADVAAGKDTAFLKKAAMAPIRSTDAPAPTS